MYLEPWMIIALVLSFGACAYLNYKSGRRSGILLGIEGAFAYLESNKIIKYMNDGSIQGTNKKLKIQSVDILSDT